MKIAIAVLICIASAGQTFGQREDLKTEIASYHGQIVQLGQSQTAPATTQPQRKVHTKLEVGMTRVEMLSFLKAHPNMKILSNAIVAARDGSKEGVEQVEIAVYGSQVSGGIRVMTDHLYVELSHKVISSVKKE